MTLNKRVSLLILPVLIVVYLLVAISVYVTQKKSVVEMMQRSLDLQATEAYALMQRYLSVGDNFIDALLYSNSLLNYFRNDDKRFKALSMEKNLDSLLLDFETLSSDYWAVALIRPSGQVEYYFENSTDPFAKISQLQLSHVNHAFTDKHFEHIKVLTQEKGRLLLVRIFDQYTFKPPIRIGNEGTVALMISIEPTAFLDKLQSLHDTGIQIAWPQGDVAKAESGLSATVDFPQVGRLTLTQPAAQLQAELNRLRFSLLIGFVVITVFSYLILSYLINHYVIGPIHKLQQRLAQVDIESDGQFEAFSRLDEIGSLSRTFRRLYDSLGHSYRLTKKLAERDSLTGLYNRRIFQDVVDNKILLANEQEQRFTLFFVDMDNFKYVNDRYGHDRGDALLKAFAQSLSDCIERAVPEPGCRVVARLAGDEFAVFISCPAFTSSRDVEQIGTDLVSICQSGFSVDKQVLPVSLSVGAARYPDDATTADELLKNADEAMYEAKRAGKNRLVFYSDQIKARQSNQQSLEVALQHLNSADLSISYMPVIKPDTGKPCALEVLVRWHPPGYSAMYPGDFIPMAERLGILERISDWVFERSLQDFTMLKQLLGEDIRLAINVTSAQLSSQHFATTVSTLLTRYAVEAKHIDLEVTESCDTRLFEYDINRINYFKKLGFKLILDDFGRGNISIAQLIDYPIDGMKFSQSFVDALTDYEKSIKIKALIQFCHTQNWQVFAEGVEQSFQATLLKEAGCDGLQGYFYARPLSLSELQSQHQH